MLKKFKEEETLSEGGYLAEVYKFLVKAEKVGATVELGNTCKGVTKEVLDATIHNLRNLLTDNLESEDYSKEIAIITNMEYMEIASIPFKGQLLTTTDEEVSPLYALMYCMTKAQAIGIGHIDEEMFEDTLAHILQSLYDLDCQEETFLKTLKVQVERSNVLKDLEILTSYTKLSK